MFLMFIVSEENKKTNIFSPYTIENINFSHYLSRKSPVTDRHLNETITVY